MKSKSRPTAPLRIIVTCLAFWGVALWLVSRFPIIEGFGIRITVVSVRAALGLLGHPVDLVGNVLHTGRTGMEIATDCSPHLAYLIFAGGVIATPASWRQRVIGLGVGALAIHVFNTLRILALYAVLAARSNWFEFVHVYLWQIGTIGAVLGAFTLWLMWTGRRAPTA
ncbi:MAG: archaeosortase/exosortase family protein [Candidatus Eisenbacteria bacterium]|uniref:Archaeosortase/exosortase family protein n=1 Tax=Eiseniibacteriota bacterium TaxID=2212470 RepID=A0A849SFS8_UNCEI|nr:archaeosortase/exosortase family protein [Candidatus Eisenbacteria bacterium]